AALRDPGRAGDRARPGVAARDPRSCPRRPRPASARAACMTAPVIVFVGPTLEVADARRELDATYLGPVAQGDVLRAVEARPQAIAIIDGYFASVPTVWHKEILWALSQGVR